MRNSSPNHWVDLISFEPSQETSHLTWHAVRQRSFEVNRLPAYWAADDLRFAISVLSDRNFAHPTSACWEESRVPAEDALVVERDLEPLRGVKHHFHHTIDMAIRYREPSEVHAEPPGDGGTHLLHVEELTLNLAGLSDIL